MGGGSPIHARTRPATLSPRPRDETRRGEDTQDGCRGDRPRRGLARAIARWFGGTDSHAPQGPSSWLLLLAQRGGLGDQRPPGPCPRTRNLVGKRKAGNGNRSDPARTLHFRADRLSFPTCHEPLTFSE